MASPKTSLMPIRLLILSLLVCISCSEGTTTPGEDPEVTRLRTDLQIVYQDPSAAFLGIWGPSASELYIVGGSSLENGGRILRYDGEAFKTETVPEGPLLWWVHGIDSDHVWAVGEGGRILRKQGEDWTDESPDIDERLVLWGVWAAAPDDIWAVGGSVRRNGPKGVVLRSDGNGQWRRVEDAFFPSELNLYKVWGSRNDDVYIVGEGGVVLHFDGRIYRRLDTGVSDLIFTIHGTDTDRVAVGGSDVGQIFSLDARGWTEQAPGGIPGLNGVFMRDNGVGLAVGHRGVILYRDEAGSWSRVRPKIQSIIGARTLHAVWAQSYVWSVGGDLSEMNSGMIVTDDQRFRRRVDVE